MLSVNSIIYYSYIFSFSLLRIDMIQKTLFNWFIVLNLQNHDQMHEWQRNQKDEGGSLNLLVFSLG